MNTSKRRFSQLLTIAVALITACNPIQKPADQTTGYYENPVLGGDYPDPSVVRVGNDYYLTTSSFDYYPGLLIWHSTDLIHWERIAHALHQNVGSVWAPDLVYIGGKFFVYFPAGGTNWVVSADSPEGPWSDPIDLNLRGFIDPGHVMDAEGNRFLYLSKGYVVKLTSDGLATEGEPVANYDGWEFPKEWSTECFCLESPKSTVRNGFFYLTTAEGGTAGPATSHMVVSARAKSPYGPFENSPFNPIVHTTSRSERWWSQGHGTLVDDVDGNWWILYHGYENGFHTLGRQTLMLPVEWTNDNWFRVPEGLKSSDNLPLPSGEKSVDSRSLSDDFSGNEPGLQWQFYKLYNPERISLADKKLELKAEGTDFSNSAPLLVNSCDRKYEVSVEFWLEPDVQAGLTLFYNEIGNLRIEATNETFTVFNQSDAKIRVPNTMGNHGFLRIVNDENEISFYVSDTGKDWTRVERSIEASGFNHNVFGKFLSLRAGIYAFGEGKAVFDNFEYHKI